LGTRRGFSGELPSLMLLRLLSLSLMTTGLLQAESHLESYTETHPLEGHGQIRIDDTNGSISIRTWARPEVSIQVEKRAGSEERLKEIQVEIDAGPRDLSIRTIFPHHFLGWIWNSGDGGSVRLVLTVPESADLAHVTMVNGTITIDGVHGMVDARTVNGGIKATGLGDEADLSAVNGSIQAEAAALGPRGRLHLTTINGSIAIRLGRDANATFSASTINGGTSCEFPIRLTEESHRRGMQGVIGTGGGSISATTVNGSIRLQAL
jgi:hypothetical protein